MRRVLVVEDHGAFRQPLAFFLRRKLGAVDVIEAGSLAAARCHLETVDLMVLDLDLPDGRGETLIRELRAAHRKIPVLVLTASQDRLEVARAIEAGASGWVHKSAALGQVLEAVQQLAAGAALLDPAEAIELLRLAGQDRERRYEAEQSLRRLTGRERELLAALGEGLSDKQIAQQLHISVETVRTHMVNLLGKLGVESRLQALVFALRYGALALPPSSTAELPPSATAPFRPNTPTDARWSQARMLARSR